MADSGASDVPAPTVLFSRLLVGGSGKIAHRAGAFRAPENTIDAVRQAWADGAIALEIDVCLSKDGVPIIVHDVTLDRTCDCPTGTSVRNLTAEEIRRFNAAAKFVGDPTKTYSNATVPTLQEVCEEAVKVDLGVFFDIKDTRTAKHVAAVFDKFPALYRTSCVVSFNPYSLKAVRKLNPRVPIMLTHKTRVLTTSVGAHGAQAVTRLRWVAACVEGMLTRAVHDHLWISLKACGVLLWKDDVDEEAVALWVGRGLRVVAWTVNSAADKDRLAALGVAYMTDNLLGEAPPPLL